MRRAAILIGCLIIVGSASIGDTFAQRTTISIDNIVPDQSIGGRVSGLPQGSQGKYKVVVYVRTDQWYVHPYAGQGEGASWAPVQSDGSWEIGTVKRRFKSSKVAALVVRKDYPEKPKINNLGEIPSVALVVKTLKGTPDYGAM